VVLLRVIHTLVLWLWAMAWCLLLAWVAMAVVLVDPEASLAIPRRIWPGPLFWMARIRLRVEPLPDLDWKKPHVFVMNHQSNLDIPAACAALPVNIRFVAKRSLAFIPFVGWYMWLAGMIFVNRSDRASAVSSMRRAGERIRAGANILTYPEGTRSRGGNILPFKKGTFVLALEAGVPIVPIAIEGSRAVQPSDDWTIRPGVIRVKVGAPIPTKGRGPEARDELLREVREAVIRLHREIGGQGDGGAGAADDGQGREVAA